MYGEGGGPILAFCFPSERKLHIPKYSGVRIASLSRDRNPATRWKGVGPPPSGMIVGTDGRGCTDLERGCGGEGSPFLVSDLLVSLDPVALVSLTRCFSFVALVP